MAPTQAELAELRDAIWDITDALEELSRIISDASPQAPQPSHLGEFNNRIQRIQLRLKAMQQA